MFRTLSEPFERNLKILKPLEKIAPFTSGQAQSLFKILYFGGKLCNLAQVRGSKVRCLVQDF